MTDEELKKLIAENAKGMKELRNAQLQTDAKLAKIGDQIIATDGVKFLDIQCRIDNTIM